MDFVVKTQVGHQVRSDILDRVASTFRRTKFSDSFCERQSSFGVQIFETIRLRNLCDSPPVGKIRVTDRGGYGLFMNFTPYFPPSGRPSGYRPA